MKKFEYLELKTMDRITVSQLNALGLNGWELIYETIGEGAYIHYYFKREIVK